MKRLIGLKALFKGLFTVLSHLCRKSVTLEYPEVRPNLNTFFRGKHILENCIGCGFCQKVCPCDAIYIEKNNNIMHKYIIDFSKCMFCGNCMYYCPQKSMCMCGGFELGIDNKESLKLVIENKRR